MENIGTPLAIAITTLAMIVDIWIRDLELTALATLAIVAHAVLHGFWGYLAIAIAVAFAKPVVRMLLLHSRSRLTKLYATFRSLAYVILYLVSGIAFGYMSLNISIPFLDLWTGRVLYLLTIFLALSLTVDPSIDTLSCIAVAMMKDIENLSKVLYVVAIAVGSSVTLYSLIAVTRHYTAVSMIVAVLAWVLAKKRTRHGKRVAILSFFIALLIVVLCVD